MDDLSGAIGSVILIDLLALAISVGVFVWWQRQFHPSTLAVRAVQLGLICGYVGFLRWAIVPTNQIGRAILIAALLGAAIGAAVWLVGLWLTRHRTPSDS